MSFDDCKVITFGLSHFIPYQHYRYLNLPDVDISNISLHHSLDMTKGWGTKVKIYSIVVYFQ
jgi:hypothetical protein